MKRRLWNQATSRWKTQYSTWNDGHTETEEIPMIGRRFFQVVLGSLRQNGTDVVIDEEEEVEHEGGKECTEDASDSDALGGVDDP